jgi:hypothetical protein
VIRNKPLRRAIAGALLAAGAALMWLAPNALFGAVLFALGVALEALGIYLEHQDRK